MLKTLQRDNFLFCLVVASIAVILCRFMFHVGAYMNLATEYLAPSHFFLDGIIRNINLLFTMACVGMNLLDIRKS